jgi:sterol desaturase/sphingolipid hydroxylase (fatty acid hydroxylase superfamily)
MIRFVSKRWRWIAFGVAVGVLAIAERRRPLRRAKEPGPERVGRNLAIGVLAALTTAASELPVIAPARHLAERRQLGLLRWLRAPRALKVVLGFLLLDYTLYLWHRLNHHASFLWRFHAVHHIDRDLDSTTGLRFHFGELGLSAGFRAAQILLIGVDPGTMAVWQHVLLLSVVFHHSNLELPGDLEERLNQVVVTPRMHGIHHSVLGREMNSNYASLLPWWDWLHRTFRADVPQSTITVGVEGFLEADRVTLERSLTLPFRDESPPPPRT